MASSDYIEADERVAQLMADLARAKADNQEIMKINNQLRAAMIDVRHIIESTVK